MSPDVQAKVPSHTVALYPSPSGAQMILCNAAELRGGDAKVESMRQQYEMLLDSHALLLNESTSPEVPVDALALRRAALQDEHEMDLDAFNAARISRSLATHAVVPAPQL